MASGTQFARLRDWLLHGGGLRRVNWRGVLHLFSGGFANSVIMLLATLLAARTLEPQQYGMMVLVLAIGRVSERLLRFESWQPLIRFVAEEEQHGNPATIARLYLFGLLLDIGSAFAAALLAISFGLLAAGLVGLDAQNAWLILIYACAIAVNLRGMPSAALRLAGKFRALAYFQLFANSLRLMLAGVCFLADAGLVVFIVVWTAAQMLDSLLFLAYGLKVVRDGAIPSPLRASTRGLRRDFPDFLKFAVSTNLSSMLRTFTHEMDTLLVGAFAGPAMAGLYNLAKRMAKLAQQMGDMIQTVVYPDLSRLWSAGSTSVFRQTVLSLQLLLFGIALGVFLVILIIGKPLILMAFGSEYAGIYPLLIAQIIAVAFIMHSAPSRSALLAMNRPRFVLLVALVSTAGFFATAFAIMPTMGALGANIAHIVFGALTAVMLDIACWRQGRRRLTRGGTPSGVEE